MAFDKSKRVKVNRILTLTVILAIFAVSLVSIFAFHKTKRAEVKNGVVDLRYWNSAAGQPLYLNGDWNFYWNRFVTDKEIKSGSVKPDLTATAPTPWNDYKMSGKNLPGFGYGTYEIKVLNANPSQRFAFNIPPFSTAYRLYVNERLLATNGKIGTSKGTFSPEVKPQVVEFLPPKQNFEIVINVSNFTCAQGGMLFAIQMGTPAQIYRGYNYVFGLDLFLLGILIIVALYYLAMFFVQRKVFNGLYACFICLLMAVRTLTTGDVLILRLIPSISYGALIAIDYLSLCWLPTCAVFIFKGLFPEEKYRHIRFQLSSYYISEFFSRFT